MVATILRTVKVHMSHTKVVIPQELSLPSDLGGQLNEIDRSAVALRTIAN